MKKIFLFFFLFKFYLSSCQTINLNESYLIDYLRISQLQGKFKTDFSFTQRPIHLGSNGLLIADSVFNKQKHTPTIAKIFKEKVKIKILPIDFNIEYNSHHPYKNNNGSMIPNRGIQNIIGVGFYTEIGPLSIQFKPEFLNAQNQNYEGFWEGHYDVIWRMKYNQWNQIDIPEDLEQKHTKNQF